MKNFINKISFFSVCILFVFLFASCTNDSGIHYTVQFDLNGGTSEHRLTHICEENSLFTLFTPKKENYAFGGWMLDGEIIQTNRIEVTRDMTLTATWIETSFTIELDANGGTTSFEHIEVMPNAPFELPIPEKKGCKFLGWYLNDDLYTEAYFTQSSNITLVAKWEVLNYTIHFIVDDIVTEDIIVKYGEEITLPQIQKPGYQFIGWLLNEKPFDETIYLYETDLSLTATFSKETYQITLVDETETILPIQLGDAISLPILSKKGFTFLGWFNKEIKFEESIWNETSNLTLYAKWEKIPYEITLQMDDVQKKVTIYYGDIVSLDAPTKKGHTFVGWYEGDTRFEEKVWERTNDVTLTAHFTPNSYTITLKDEGQNDQIITIGYGEEIHLPILSKDGFTFKGWYFNDVIFSDTIWERESSIILSAKWEKSNQQTLINAFDILLYNYQNSTYDQISLYTYDEHISASKYWQKIAIQKINDAYYVSGIAASGESLSSLGSYDYVMLAYSSYSRYSEFVGMNISIGDLVVFDTDITILNKGDVNVHVSFYHEEKELPSLDEIKSYFARQYSGIDEVSNHIDLITHYEDYMVTWKTSNKDVISSTGKYNKPYTTRNVTLTAIIENQEVYSFSFIVRGEKEKSEALATGYFYTNTSSITENSIKNLDIIYCAFAYVNENGEITNVAESTNFIKGLRTYILPLAKKYGTKVLISINESNGAFGTVAMNPELSKKFAENIVNLINHFGLDGIDIDWEYPTVQETPYFTTMMKDIYEAVKTNNPDHLVTAAIGGGKWQPPRYDLANSAKYLDYINLMTYSMTSANGQFQNALYKSTKGYTLVSCTIEESIAIYDSYGVPRSKILVGLAFYGIRQYDSNGLGTPSSSSASISFSSIYNTYLANLNPNIIIGYDEETESPYIYDKVNKILISYENERSIARKCEYVNTLGLGGVMYWQDGHDYGDTLVNAVIDNINK